ncbi:hypothetical protein L0244_01700 [bacterium]|nr:hypothetical protein [bacterium]
MKSKLGIVFLCIIAFVMACTDHRSEANARSTALKPGKSYDYRKKQNVIVGCVGLVVTVRTTANG